MKRIEHLGHLKWQTLKLFAGDIKLSHSIFALPFVMASLVFLQFEGPWWKLVWIILCMISARSYAMGLNRYLDREGDAKNPRTSARMIPSGRLSPQSSLAWSLCFGLLFCFFAFQLNPLAGVLSPFILCILGFYPFMKKLSWLTHWYLGFCLGLSPLAASVAISGKIEEDLLLLGLAIMLWTGGFDIIYALQDQEFDRSLGLKSFPARFGVKHSLMISRLSFLMMLVCLTVLGVRTETGLLYYTGLLLITLILVREQVLVGDSREGAVSKNINAAFFSINAWVGVIFYIFTQLDAWLS
ncbi:MAG: UbiA family prenyltransferase [Deltaproteobacteria bacterium]|nr:UbiA family prenyltransferase [Deltaproteobacteria bacterium]